MSYRRHRRRAARNRYRPLLYIYACGHRAPSKMVVTNPKWRFNLGVLNNCPSCRQGKPRPTWDHAYPVDPQTRSCACPT